MAYIFLLLVMSLIAQIFSQTFNLSRIDQLLEQRYNVRNQRKLNYDPRNYPEDIRLNEVDSKFDSDLSRVKNRRYGDDDYVERRKSRPYQQFAKSSEDNDEDKKMIPIPHPIPMLVPLIMSRHYPVPVFPMTATKRPKASCNQNKFHGHGHAQLDHQYIHQLERHGHDYQSQEHSYDQSHAINSHEHDINGYIY